MVILLHQEWAGVSDPQQKPMPWVERRQTSVGSATAHGALGKYRGRIRTW